MNSLSASSGSRCLPALRPPADPGRRLARSAAPRSRPLLGDSARPAAAAPSTAAGSAGDAADRVVAEGRLVAYPGAEVVVGAELPGTLVRLLVEEKDAVRKGQLIAELRADDLRAELAEARARVDEAEADIRFAEVDLGRAERLLAEKVGTPEAADRARRNRDAAYARRETALASVRRLEAVLAKTRIVAPIDGVVITRFVQRRRARRGRRRRS